MKLEDCHAGTIIQGSEEEVPYPTTDEIITAVKKGGIYGVYYTEYMPKDVFRNVSKHVKGVLVGIIVHGWRKISVEISGSGETSEQVHSVLIRAMNEIGANSTSNAKGTVKFLLEESQTLMSRVCFLVGRSYFREEIREKLYRMNESGVSLGKTKTNKGCEISIVINGVRQSKEQILDIVGERAFDAMTNRAELKSVKDTLIEYNDKVVLYDGISCDMPPRGVLVAGLLFDRYNDNSKPITVDEIREDIRNAYDRLCPDGDIVVLSNNQIYTAFGEVNRALREASGSSSRFTKYIVNLRYGKGYVFQPKELKVSK